MSQTPRKRRAARTLPPIETTRDLTRPGVSYALCGECRAVLGDVHREIVIDDAGVRDEHYRPILQPSATNPSRVMGRAPTERTRAEAEETLRQAHVCPNTKEQTDA